MLIIAVPYRATDQPERYNQLQIFLKTMTEFLPSAYIFILEQDDNKQFNRGALLNSIISISGAGKDAVLCFHDVDLLPTKDIIHEYIKPLEDNTVRHIGRAWKRYDSDTYLGGILLMKSKDFCDINGFPNDFWGWGGEDDELRDRIIRHGLQIERSEGTIIDQENLTLKQKLLKLKKSGQKCPDKWEKRDWHKKHPNKRGLYDLEQNITQCVNYSTTCFHYKIKIIQDDQILIFCR